MLVGWQLFRECLIRESMTLEERRSVSVGEGVSIRPRVVRNTEHTHTHKVEYAAGLPLRGKMQAGAR